MKVKIGFNKIVRWFFYIFNLLKDIINQYLSTESNLKRVIKAFKQEEDFTPQSLVLLN